MIGAFESILEWFATLLSVPLWDVTAVVAILTTTLVCGLIGSLVIGNRMAFFSDAMAHTAFAGAALGVLSVILVEPAVTNLDASDSAWQIPVVMVMFGILIGTAIAFFRERTGASTDAIIGVFFALAVGFGAMIIPGLSQRLKFDPELFLFGSVVFVSSVELLSLVGLVILTLAFMMFQFNQVAFTSFNVTLARSRGVKTRWNHYIFIILLAIIVNLSIKAVGVLLINALLVVPATAASNVARNLRQMIILSVIFSMSAGLIGYRLSQTVEFQLSSGPPIQLRPAGTIIILTVLIFFITAVLAMLRGRHVHGVDCNHT